MPAIRPSGEKPTRKPKAPSREKAEKTRKEDDQVPVVRLRDRYKEYESPNSITSLTSESTAAETLSAEIDENRPATPYTHEQLSEFWTQYVNRHVDSRNRSLWLALNNRLPEMKENFVLEFPVDNRVLKQQIESISLELVNFLRKKLNNYSIVLNFPVKEGQNKSVVYSPEERYIMLAKKYPLIEKLRKNLDLDIDY